MRVAYFGGTFDPIHRGHLAIASFAAERLDLDSVLFAPTGRQPLKPAGATASFEDRLAMTKLACASDYRFEASALDAPHPDGTPNYTVHILAALREQNPSTTLFNLVGLDSFLDLPRWNAPERLLELADWIVVSRPGFTLNSLFLTPKARVHILNSVHEDISSTELRQRLHRGEPCLDLLPDTVSEYIQTHNLYR